MSEHRNVAIIRFCLALSLAIALAAVGIVVLFDYLSHGDSADGRISLAPGGGVVSLLVSTSLLALLFRRLCLTTALAAVSILVIVVQVLLPYVPADESLKKLAIGPPLFLVILLAQLTFLAVIHLRKSGAVCLMAGLLVAAIGLFSIMSYWFPQLQGATLGSIPESTIIVSPLAILVGLSLTFLNGIHDRDIPDFSPALILVAVSAIALTTATWHSMRIQNSKNLQQSARVLVNQLTASSAEAFNDDLALIRRLAQRQQPLTDLPDDRVWSQEAQSYLNDFPHIRLIGILNQNREPVGIRSQADSHQNWLNRFLQSPDTDSWLTHVTESGKPHLSPPAPDENGRMYAMIASPVSAVIGQPWHVVAVLDLENVYRNLLLQYDGGLSARVYYDRTVIYDFSNAESDREKIPLATRQVDAHHDSRWQIEVYIRQGGLPASILYLPPLVLFTGLALSFLVMLSHLFWRESERRSSSLRKLNSTVNAHLYREQSLRQTNERIMEFSRDILCSINAQGLFTSVNPASEDILGYRPDQLIGEHYSVLVPPEDLGATTEEVRVLMAGERRFSDGFRNHLRHRDGHIVTLSWTAEWSDSDQALFCVGRDMTAQLVAETLMREREQFFSLSPDMFCIVDMNGHFFELNKAFVEVLGYERDELLGASYMQLIHKEDRGRVEAAVASLVAGGTINELHVRAISKANTEQWLELSAALSSDELIYVAARDTTEIRRTQEKLRESETLLKIAERTARIGGWVVDVATRKARWTPAMFEIFGIPEGEAPDLDECLRYFTPDSSKVITDATDMCIRSGTPFDEEVQIRTGLGQLRWVRVIAQAKKDDQGQIVEVQGGLQDVTASHQAMEQISRFAERQSTIFESITDAFFTLNRDWQFIYVNQRSEELLGEPREDMLGNSIWEIFPSALDGEFERQYRYAMESGESVSFEAYYKPLDDWFEVSAYPSDEGLAVYYRSIKARRLAQQQLDKTMAELERSNRELQDFAFVASHDLQEPLRKIQAFSDRLLTQSDRFDGQERDYLNRMQSAAKRMQSLIQDLLSYSRITTRAQPLTRCDTDRILAEVLQDMETMISRENAELDIAPLPPIIGDATQLRQVFQNLLSNAIKFHQPGENPKVRVYAEDSTDRGWTLVVSDQGVGFDEQYADKLFDPFQRLHKQAFPGTGIGMAIVRKILDRHEAIVTVQSRIDQGTTFRIFFPTTDQTRTDSDE